MIQRRAYYAVRMALKRGVLVRPPNCGRCGAIPRKGSDGRSTIHAHHHDYARPLDVEWVCAACHRAETPLPAKMGAPTFGAANGMRKSPRQLEGSKNGWALLDEAKVAKIKAMRGRRVKEIAAEFGVSTWAIYDILRGRNWSQIAAAPLRADPQTGGR